MWWSCSTTRPCSECWASCVKREACSRATPCARAEASRIRPSDSTVCTYRPSVCVTAERPSGCSSGLLACTSAEATKQSATKCSERLPPPPIHKPPRPPPAPPPPPSPQPPPAAHEGPPADDGVAMVQAGQPDERDHQGHEQRQPDGAPPRPPPAAHPAPHPHPP